MKRNGYEYIEQGWGGHRDARYINERQIKAACNAFFHRRRMEAADELELSEQERMDGRLKKKGGVQ